MAINSNVANALRRHYRPCKVYKYQSEIIQPNGEKIKNAFLESESIFAVLSISPKELQTLPDGMYDKFDRKFYSDSLRDLPTESLIELIEDGEKFKIMSRDDRFFEGGFSVYYGKRILKIK